MPDYSIIQKLCEAIHVTLPELMDGEDAADSSVRVYDDAQILDLLRNLNDRINSSIMFITHDLGVIAEMADYVGVMYAGRIVEIGPVAEVLHHPKHPYTKGLMAAIPDMTESGEFLHQIEGSMPSLAKIPSGCAFHNRCPRACERCVAERPPLTERGPQHSVACWLSEKHDASEENHD